MNLCDLQSQEHYDSLVALNVIDVGASVGLFGNFIADQSHFVNGTHSVNVICIEPIVEIASKIIERENLKVIAKAVLSEDLIPNEGIRSFNLASNSELSSFLNLNPKINEDLWKAYLSALVVQSKILVPCTTLEKIIQDSSWEKVDFLKIDVQGTDLAVFLSAGNEMDKIVACVLEFPFLSSSAIYSGEKNLNEGIEILGRYGFIPVRIVPNGAGECNAFFLNSKYSLEEYFEVEELLQFVKAPTLKIGRHDPLINFSMTKRVALRITGFLYMIYETKLRILLKR